MDFRDLYKQTEKVGMEEFSKIVSSKGIKSLNESGDPKVMVTAKENDSVTFLVGDKKYVYKGLSPSLIDRFEGRLKNKAGFKALNWLKAQTAKEQRFEVKDGKEVSTNESSSFPTNFTKILKTSSGKIKHPADKGYEEVKQDDRGSKAVHYRCTTCNKPHDEKESAAKCCRNYESKINERDSLEAWRETIEEESKKIGIKSHSKMDVDNCLKFIAKHYGAIQANKAIDDFKLESKGYKKLKEFKENDGTPEPQKSVTFTPEKLKELKKIYASTIKDGKSQFTFEGQELLVSYAKYLIQHLENVFGTGKNECKVNESADDMSDEELMAWYKEEMSKGLEPRLINSLKLKLEARGLKVDESKKVNEDDMMNGGATTASDSSNVVANPNPPTVDNDVNKEEQDQVKKSKSTKDDIADDAEKEEDEESKKDLTYLGNSGGDKYFYLYEKPAAEMDESVEVKENRVDQTKDGWVVQYKEGKNKEVKTKKFPTKEEADKFLAKVVIDEKTDTPFDPSFGSKVRAKGLADRTPAGIPTDKKEEEIKLPNRKEVLDKHFKANDEVEELEKSWKADNSKVPNESKITEISQKDIPSYLSAHIKRAKEIGQDPINYLMTRFGHTKKEAQIALEKYGKEDYKEPIQGDYYPESIVHIPYTLVEKILKIVEKSKINELGVAQRVNFNKELHDLSIELSNAMKNNDHNRVIELKKQIARFSDNNESKVNESCPDCGSNEVRDGKCGHCGNPIGGVECPDCGSKEVVNGKCKHCQNPIGARECPGCGSKETVNGKCKYCGRVTEAYTTSSDTSGQPANSKAAAQDVKDSASHEKSQTGLGQVKEDTDYDDKTPAKIADLQILDAEDEVVFSAKKHQLDPNDVKGFLTAALKELEISNISYDVVIDYLLPTEDEVVNPEEPTDEELKAEPTEEPYPAAQGEPVPQQQDKNESIDKSLLEKFGLTPPIEVDGSTSMWAPGEDDSPDANTDEETVNPYEVDESLMLKYGFLTESTATLFEKFGLIIDEANENLSPEDIARIKKMVDEEYKKEHKDKLTEPKKDKKVNEIEDLSTPDVNGVPSITGVDQEKNQLPTNQQADKAPGIVEKPGVGMLTTESKFLNKMIGLFGGLNEGAISDFSDEEKRKWLNKYARNIVMGGLSQKTAWHYSPKFGSHSFRTFPNHNELEDFSKKFGDDQEMYGYFVEWENAPFIYIDSNSRNTKNDLFELKTALEHKLNKKVFSIVDRNENILEASTLVWDEELCFKESLETESLIKKDVASMLKESISKEEITKKLTERYYIDRRFIPNYFPISKLNEDGEGLVPNQPTSDQTVNQDVPPQGEPTATDDPTMADSGEDTDKEPAADYSTPESAMAQIDMDYPEDPLKSLALAFCDSFINDPNVYKGLRKMQFEGTWVDADTINDLAKVVGDYRNFTPDVIKLTSERLGNGCKYKLGRNNGPTLTLVLRDPDFSISLSGLKELVNAKEVNKTDNPGEVVLSW